MKTKATKLTRKQLHALDIERAFENGFRRGLEQGKLDTLASMSYKDKQQRAQIDILQAASSFQEGVTKLVMSINNQL